MSECGTERSLRVVEASAGTGKTFRITQLVVRKVSAGTRIDRIVLASYTNAAAEELAERVRTALARALDPRAHGDGETALPDAAAAAHLRRAISDLDGACIGTIHSFCARLLQDAAEAAGALSLDGMSPDESSGDVQAEVTADLWAACVAPSHLAISTLGDTPSEARAMLARIVGAVDGEPDARIEPMDPWTRIVDLERRIDALVSGADADCRTAVSDVIGGFRKEAATRLQAMVDATATDPAARQVVLAGAHGFRRASDGEWPVEGMKVKRERVQEWARTPAGARAVSVLQQLDADWREARAGLRAALGRRARAALLSRRDARRTYSFGDLVARTWRLVSEAGSPLVAHARSRYEMAIIDECQDTDPLQQAIFRTIFDAPDRELHVVGDPKQSIYGFRGADLPSYIRLRDSGTADDPLVMSFRSDAAHVAGVEGLFTAHDAPFGSRDITFTPISARHRRARCVGADGSGKSGIEVMALDSGTSVTSQREAAMRATAARIRQWLDSEGPCGLRIPDGDGADAPLRPVSPGDVAVLCHRRNDLDAMRAELDRLGIPSVYSGDSSVMLSAAAEDLHAILVACASIRSAQYAVAAAMTRSLGATSGDVRMRRDAWIGAVRSCARTLERRGIDAALVELLERPIPHARDGEGDSRSCIELLLAQAGGERHAVDLQHMRELLSEAERTGTHGAAALAQWIRTSRDAIERAGGRGSGDTARLRTQATRNAVTLQTLHSSKGLTYAFVCLPTVALGSRPQPEPAVVRTTEDDGNGSVTRVIDLGSRDQPDRARAQQQEQQREQTRLLYVAMTRARYVTCVCVPVAPALRVTPSALEQLLAAHAAAGKAAPGVRMSQLQGWAERAAAVHERLDPPGPGGSARGHADPQRGAAVRIVAEAPVWTGALWSAPSMGAMASLDPPVVDWADLQREASFTSLSRGAVHADAAGSAGTPMAEPEMDERVEPDPVRDPAPERQASDVAIEDAADPDAHDGHGSDARGDSGSAATGCASAVDGAIRRLGVRGVELGVAMHAALDAAFASLADASRAHEGAADAPTEVDSDRLAGRIAAECAGVPGIDAPDGARTAAVAVAQALRAALSQPLGFGCPAVTGLAAREDTVLRELRISVPMGLRQDALADAFATFGGDMGARVAPALARAPASQVHGLLSGIIDIAARAQPGQWHIIDWKTNDLGRSPRAYAGRALEDAAASSLYPVQAALYMMLLSRWLRRIGDPSEVVASHYLYLRGMDASAAGTGVWSWSPGHALIDALDRAVGAAGHGDSVGGVS
jgi:exodeoxyribonuclease V beta subunit